MKISCLQKTNAKGILTDENKINSRYSSYNALERVSFPATFVSSDFPLQLIPFRSILPSLYNNALIYLLPDLLCRSVERVVTKGGMSLRFDAFQTDEFGNLLMFSKELFVRIDKWNLYGYS